MAIHRYIYGDTFAGVRSRAIPSPWTCSASFVIQAEKVDTIHTIHTIHTLPPRYDGALLAAAEDLAARLMPAFDTPSGLPALFVNLRKVRGARVCFGGERYVICGVWGGGRARGGKGRQGGG